MSKVETGERMMKSMARDTAIGTLLRLSSMAETAKVDQACDCYS